MVLFGILIYTKLCLINLLYSGLLGRRRQWGMDSYHFKQSASVVLEIPVIGGGEKYDNGTMS